MLRRLLGSLLGRRLAVTTGEVVVAGIGRPVRVRRDRYGIPVIEASDDADAWFGLGFCHGQDRAVQLEAMKRLAAGTVSELAGKAGLPLDRVARRVGFRRAAEAQLAALTEAHRRVIAAYVAGANAGTTAGLRKRPHEFAILNRDPTPLEPADVLALLKLQSFLISSNWAAELARLRIARADGIDAVAALEPRHPEWLGVTAAPGEPPGAAVDRLAEDLSAFASMTPVGGASNNWAIAGRKTATGRPLLSSDPHLPPFVPNSFYLAHLRTPDWCLRGASFAGTPSFPIAHNARAAWGVTSGLIDDTDLFVEELGPDGRSVRRGDGREACEVIEEVIAVRGGKSVVERVLITPRGPVISPLGEGDEVISMSATWLKPGPLRGWLDAQHAGTFAEFRSAFEDWPAASQNLVFADVDGTIGWQLAGTSPVRRRGHGMIPAAGWDPANGWEPDPVPFRDMPHGENPPNGFVATANSKPTRDDDGPFLGLDFLDGYRLAVIASELDARDGWTVDDCLRLQMNVRSLVWQEIRDIVLSAEPDDAAGRRAREVLRDWDGQVAADSEAATVFELFVTAMCQRIVAAKAPRGTRWAMGTGFWLASPQNLLGQRRAGHMVRLLRTRPEGWFDGGWDGEIAAALCDAGRGRRGAWGPLRPARFFHVLFGTVWPLNRVLDPGPVPYGGDENTPCQAAVIRPETLSPPGNVATLRAVFDVGDWSNSRFSLSSGQSGNPCSPHYADQLETWRRGEGLPIPWTDAEVEAAAVAELRLTPAES